MERNVYDVLEERGFLKQCSHPEELHELLGKEKGKLADFIVKPAGRPVIAPIGDKRKALSGVNVCFDVLESDC